MVLSSSDQLLYRTDSGHCCGGAYGETLLLPSSVVDHFPHSAASTMGHSSAAHPHPLLNQTRRVHSNSRPFLYKWFHPSDDEHVAKDSHDHASQSSRLSSSSASSASSLDDVASSSAPIKRNNLMHRLFHSSSHSHNDLHHISSSGTTSDDLPSVIPQPPKITDSPSTHRKYALLQRLFHQAEHGSSNGHESLGRSFGESFFHHRKTNSQSQVMKKLNSNDVLAIENGAYDMRMSSATNADGSQDGKSGLRLSGSSHDTFREHESSGDEVESHEDGNNQLHQTTMLRSTNVSKDNLPHHNGQPVDHAHESSPSHTPIGKSRKNTPTSESGSLRRFYLFKSLLQPHQGSHNMTMESNGSSPTNSQIISEKYGSAERVIGKGAGGTVKLFHKIGYSGPNDKLYAVKEFRKRRKNESEKDYVKKLASEFCISSNLHHMNVVETIDLIQDDKLKWCEIMEYCAGGDLYEVLKYGKMTMLEINCCFKQLIRGVEYLHSMGVAHRDLKPENLLISATGSIKITDFGVSDVFRTCWDKEPHKSKGLCGSEPYIAPEEFSGDPYDARKVDIWSCGIIYYAMLFHGVPWRCATLKDPNYSYYLEHRGWFEPFMRLPPTLAHLLGRILDPMPSTRVTIEEILSDPFFMSIEVCESGIDKLSRQHHHFINGEVEKSLSTCSSNVGTKNDSSSSSRRSSRPNSTSDTALHALGPLTESSPKLNHS